MHYKNYHIRLIRKTIVATVNTYNDKLKKPSICIILINLDLVCKQL